MVVEALGVVVDYRKPRVLRIAPAPLYTLFGEVARFAVLLKEVLEEICAECALKAGDVPWGL